MIFSLNHRSKYAEEVGEIKIPFQQLRFAKWNTSQRCNILVSSGDNLDNIKSLVDNLEYDYTFECNDLESLLAIKEAGYNCYIRFPVADWETFNLLKDFGVSDIYIDGPLGFQCDYIAKAKGDIKIRVSPTISPNSNFVNSSRKVTSFYIRPEDLSKYEEAIDIIDFHNDKAEDALYSIYKRGSFIYPINQLIDGLEETVENPLIPETFVDNRLICGQICQVPGHNCKICNNTFFLLEHMKNYFN